MIRPIVAYGNPILNQPSSKVDIENEDISNLIDDMWETMNNANGVGLAAPQIGVLKQIFITDFDYFKEEESFNKSEIEKFQQVFINPKITDEYGENFLFSEGCLSIPDILEGLSRKNTRKNTSRPNKKEIEIGEILQKVGIKCKFLQDIDYKTLENKPASKDNKDR